MERMMIFIDLNNVESGMERYRGYGMYMDYSHMVGTLSEGYGLAGVKVYDSKPVPGNTGLKGLHTSLKNAGIDVILREPAPVENNIARTCIQKEVDTSLVVDVVCGAYENSYDVAMIVSGDRDMRPAGKCVERLGKDVVYVSFYDTMCTEFRDSENRIVLEDLFALKATDSDDHGRSMVSFGIIGEVVVDGS